MLKKNSICFDKKIKLYFSEIFNIPEYLSKKKERERERERERENH
jgi:hypothetical protein